MKLDKVISVITLRDVVREAMVFGLCLLVAFGIVNEVYMGADEDE